MLVLSHQMFKSVTAFRAGSCGREPGVWRQLRANIVEIYLSQWRTPPPPINKQFQWFENRPEIKIKFHKKAQPLYQAPVVTTESRDQPPARTASSLARLMRCLSAASKLSYTPRTPPR
jgi:hypothetical protein